MPFCLRGAVSAGLAVFVASFLLSTETTAQVVLTGLDFSFTKDDSTDPALAENQDRITSNVWLTRGFGGGVYNAAAESGFATRDPSVVSPLFTEWATSINNSEATISAENWESLTFDTWLNAYGGLSGVGHNIVDLDAVLRIVGADDESNLDDTYLDIRFTSWSIGGAGGFSYLRAQPPAPEPTGDYNGNHVVDAADYTIWRDTFGQMVANPGDGADGDRSGTIDLPDYDHWKARFGNVVPTGAGGGAIAGSPSSAAVPEPAATVFLLAGLVTILMHRR